MSVGVCSRWQHPHQLFVMQLDTAAPIVHVADTDITVAEDTSVTLYGHNQRGQ